jgi:hypothetical protein
MENTEQCVHTFEDHPNVCDECGECFDRAELIDFLDNGD